MSEQEEGRSPNSSSELREMMAMMTPELKDRMLKRWIDLRSAYEERMQQRLHRQAKLNERLVRKNQDLAFGTDPGDGSDDDMSRIGDEFNYIVNQAPQQKQGSIGTIGKLFFAAALVASGAGLGTLAPLVADYLKPQPQQESTPASDHDTHFGIGIYRGDQ